MKSSCRIPKGLLVTLGVLALAAASTGSHAGRQQLWGSDSNPAWVSRPPAQANVDPLPTSGPPPQNYLYFTPQDENSSATVLFVVNTSAVDVVVPI